MGTARIGDTVPKKQPTAAKKARAATRQGEKYTVARRGQAEQVTATLTRAAGYSFLWTLNIPGHGPFGRVSLALSEYGRDHDLDRALDEYGWRATAPIPPGELPLTFAVPVVRSTPGERIARRREQTEQLYTRTGRDFHDIQEPYGCAVAVACERAGLPVTDFWADPGEPRSIVITLTPDPQDPDDDEDEARELLIIWTDAQAWEYAWGDGRGRNDQPEPLPGNPGPLFLPADVAEAVRTYLKRDPVLPLDAPAWEPPADYAPDARPFDLDTDDPDPAFEASLAAYLTHPDWLAHTAGRDHR